MKPFTKAYRLSAVPELRPSFRPSAFSADHFATDSPQFIPDSFRLRMVLV